MEKVLPYQAYNKSNKERARTLRKNQTPSEKVIREKVLRKKQTWYTFLRQKMIGSYILDFYCSKLLFGIEIDGRIHDKRKDYDAIRSNFLQHQWIKILRFTNEEVFKDIEKVKNRIMEYIRERKKKLL